MSVECAGALKRSALELRERAVFRPPEHLPKNGSSLAANTPAVAVVNLGSAREGDQKPLDHTPSPANIAVPYSKLVAPTHNQNQSEHLPTPMARSPAGAMPLRPVDDLAALRPVDDLAAARTSRLAVSAAEAPRCPFGAHGAAKLSLSHGSHTPSAGSLWCVEIPGVYGCGCMRACEVDPRAALLPPRCSVWVFPLN